MYFSKRKIILKHLKCLKQLNSHKKSVCIKKLFEYSKSKYSFNKKIDQLHGKIKAGVKIPVVLDKWFEVLHV